MVIPWIAGGLGNQLWRYAAGRRLAHKWNTELKLDLNSFHNKGYKRTYFLDKLNTNAIAATPEEIHYLKELREGTSIGPEKNFRAHKYMPEVLDWPDNIYLHGCWENERYFADIADIIRQEFTLKQPLGAAAQYWQKKILAAQCSVSVHVRHGDFINLKHDIFAILPLEYYYECVRQLKQHSNPTAFVFSNNLQWCRENLRLSVPMEFVAGDGLADFEELYLMSLCQHNVIANSTFSWWGAWLNKNSDKKVFVPIPSNIVGTDKTYRGFSAERNENSPLQSDRWIRMPFDLNKQLEIKTRPYFSLLLVVNNDAATLIETLGSILGQDYKFYELIIIDNASFDGSGKICQQVAKDRSNVTLIKLYDKVSNSAAWNRAIDASQGNYLLFLKGNDRIFVNALTFLYMANEGLDNPNEFSVSDIVSSVAWLREDDRGTVNISGKKFVVDKDLPFRDLKGNVQPNLNKMTLLRILSSNAKPVPLATRAFKRKFLLDNEIRFDERVSDNDAELLFTVEAMLRTGKIIFTPQPIYAAPKADTLRGEVLT